ncbi:MAG: asparagine synthase (glutamine-hydrolyzing) [Fibrobacter sp.]|nr:asparagine synthase (glutamine-hydrolyzing) [Fibrobacter sp.]
MCGIAGIITNDNSMVNERELRAMTDSLMHRGPDDGGVQCFDGPAHTGLHAGLGHRRLSIIDLSAQGHQPMANEDRTIWISFNGEIYNYKDLRMDLIRRRHTFSSETDTEVILHGYEEYGNEICSKIKGMFAFAIWDGNRGELLLARDRFGKKPLYYWLSPNGIVFASELKAFLHLPTFRTEIDIRCLSLYCAFEYVPTPFSIYKNVLKLPAGAYLTYDGKTSSIKKYWSISFSEGKNSKNSEKDIEENIAALLGDAVRKRLMSDVALGSFLSGGIDSSAVVALMCDYVDPGSIKTFSIGFEDPSFDESSYARYVANHFKTDHREKVFTTKELLDILPKVWGFLDEPYADASILPTFMLSQFTRETVTVALGGDGGDELFCGYDPFLAHKLAYTYEKIPGFLKRGIIEPFIAGMPVSAGNMSLDFRLKQFVKGMKYPISQRNQAWLGAFPPEQQNLLFSDMVKEELSSFNVYGIIDDAWTSCSFRDWIDEITFMYEHFYLGEDILTKVDRASMAVSLEVRTPFLDTELSEYVNSLPGSLKLHGLTRKYILKKALERKLPKEIIYRKKKGFGIPLTKWLREDLRPVLENTLLEDTIKKDGLFNFNFIRQLMQEHFSGVKDNRKQLWTLLMFHKWKERFCG